MKLMMQILSIILLTMQTIQANVLLKASEISLNSPDQKTNLNDIKAVIKVQCNYSYGIFLEHFKNCGTTTLEVFALNEKINLPEIKFYKGIQGKKLKNYNLQINFFEKQNWLGGLNLFGEESLKSLNLEGKTLYIHKISAGKIDLTHKGRSIFLGELTQNENAYLQISLLPKNDFNELNFTSAFTSGASLNSDNSSYSLKDKKLSKMTEVFLPNDAYISFINPTQDHLKLWISLGNYKDNNFTLNRSLEIPAHDKSFEELESIELN